MRAFVPASFVAVAALVAVDLQPGLAEESAELAPELAGPGFAANAVVGYWEFAR